MIRIDFPRSSKLGTSWEIDSDQTIEKLKKKKIEWLIVDHYSLDIMWEEKLRPYVNKIMVIDDLGDRQHNCDLLLDQNLDSYLNFDLTINHNCVDGLQDHQLP